MSVPQIPTLISSSNRFYKCWKLVQHIQILGLLSRCPVSYSTSTTVLVIIQQIKFSLRTQEQVTFMSHADWGPFGVKIRISGLFSLICSCQSLKRIRSNRKIRLNAFCLFGYVIRCFAITTKTQKDKIMGDYLWFHREILYEGWIWCSASCVLGFECNSWT